jgi:hypothetical protein
MTEIININELEPNKGQIDGLPKNPRLIKDDNFYKLKKSLEDNPEMLYLRELLVYEYESKFVIIGGNMRYFAAKELGYSEMPCKIIPKETPIENLRAYTIKDNVSFGEYDWDALANEWNSDELKTFGLDIPNFESELEKIADDIDVKDLFDIELPFYQPSNNVPNINELADISKVENLINKIEELNIDDELKKILKIRASFFADFNFQKIADFYAHSKDDNVKSIFESLGMVILAPKEALKKGFVELGENVMDL